MSYRPSPQAIRDAFRPDVEALSTPDLLRLVRGGVEKGTPQYVKKELQHLASVEAQSRGIEFPYFTACFSA